MVENKDPVNEEKLLLPPGIIKPILIDETMHKLWITFVKLTGLMCHWGY